MAILSLTGVLVATTTAEQATEAPPLVVTFALAPPSICSACVPVKRRRPLRLAAADRPIVNDHDRFPRARQEIRGGETGNSCADHADVGADVMFKRRLPRNLRGVHPERNRLPVCLAHVVAREPILC